MLSFLLNPKVLYALAIAGLCAGLWFWYERQLGHARDEGRAEAHAQWDQANVAMTEAAAESAKLRRQQADAASRGYEDRQGQIRTVYQDIEKEVEHVVTRVEYRNICLDADGLRLVAAAVSAASAGDPTSAGKPVGPVPAASSPQ